MFIEPILSSSTAFSENGPLPPYADLPPVLPRPAIETKSPRSRLAGREDHGVHGLSGRTVEIVPAHSATRRSLAWSGMLAESVDVVGEAPVEFRSRSTFHLLVVYEKGKRGGGESTLGNVQRSTRKEFAERMTFVPAGEELRERHDLRGALSLLCLCFDPARFPMLGDGTFGDPPAGRLHFEDRALFDTALKLKRALDADGEGMRSYLEALGVVLAHDLARLRQGAPQPAPQARGGLAAWQQRVVTNYIDAHLEEQISLEALAGLARLSPYHFCRAFRRSLGVPPHRYHTQRRVEHAKALLARRTLSITEIGFAVGYGETSSFTTAFRKATGVTPSAYQRSIE